MSARFDLLLTLGYLLTSAISLLTLASIAPDRFLAQSLFLLMGFGLYLYLSVQDPKLFHVLATPSYLTVVIFLLATFFFGSEVRGAVRWISFGTFNFQASEFAKPLLALFFARYFSTHPPHSLLAIIKSLLLFSLPCGLVFLQPDLGTAIVLLVIFLSELFVARAPLWLFGLLPALAVVILLLGFPFFQSYQLERLRVFIDPGSDPLGAGYNVIQSEIAVGSGGLFGKGLGAGTQSHLRFLPERHTDFIFASLVEELGLLGGILTLLVLAILLGRLATLTLRPLPPPERLFITGLLSYLSFQSFINMGMNLGIVPVTGVTLPLISYGGSSILTLSVALGIAGAYGRNSSPPHPLIEIR